MQDKLIKTENPWQKMWDFFLYYQNEPNAKKLLLERYAYLSEIDHEKQVVRLAFDNTHKFIYFLKQGEAYFNSAKQSDLIVRPLLLYYGVTSLMKAVILLHDPFYPRKTTVLQHGLTTRKKKKLHYQLLQDEIKVQREGLLPLFSQIVLLTSLPVYHKFKVAELLTLLPELQDSYGMSTGERMLIPIQLRKQAPTVWKLSFEREDIMKMNLSFTALVELIRSGVSDQEIIVKLDTNNFTIILESMNLHFIIENHKQIKRDIHGHYFLYTQQHEHLSHELIVFNMLSYLLGMLCRYDTELWGELIFSFSSSDTFIIEQILQLSLRKFPNLILNQIYRENLIFVS